MKKLLLSAVSISFLVAPTLSADEDYDHFPALQAPDTSVAICNLNNFNAKLQAILNKPQIGVEDMVKVHELTYTLENAVQRLQQDLVVIADDLERAHKASESLQQDMLRTSSNAYLSALELLLQPKECKS